jgi:hypothetical protein
MLWYETGNELRAHDPGVLLREALANGNLVAGLRDAQEIVAACDNHLVDRIVWIERDVPNDPTLKFDLNFCAYAIARSQKEIVLDVILNHTSTDDFERRLGVFVAQNGL